MSEASGIRDVMAPLNIERRPGRDFRRGDFEPGSLPLCQART